MLPSRDLLLLCFLPTFPSILYLPISNLTSLINTSSLSKWYSFTSFKIILFFKIKAITKKDTIYIYTRDNKKLGDHGPFQAIFSFVFEVKYELLTRDNLDIFSHQSQSCSYSDIVNYFLDKSKFNIQTFKYSLHLKPGRFKMRFRKELNLKFPYGKKYDSRPTLR